MKKISLFILTMLLAVFVAACGSESSSTDSSKESAEKEETKEITIKHELGEATIEVNPKKVVVFDNGVLDTLDKLGVEVAGLPKGNTPTYLSKYEDDKYANLGSLKEPDFEAISELAPDVIFISGRQQTAYEELNKIAPTIYMAVDQNNYMESFKNNMTQLGEIFGKQEEVKTELATIDESVAALNKEASALAEKGLIVLVNDGKVAAYGKGSRFGIIHDVFGVKAVDENIKVEAQHGQSISFEYIAEKNPDYLFVVDRGAVVAGESTAEKVLDNKLVNGTNAAKNGKIIYLDPGYWYLSGGGLVSVSEMIKEVQEGIKK